MNHMLMLSLGLCLASSTLQADDYLEAQKFALQSLGQSQQMLAQFDKNSLPGFNNSPSEVNFKPTQKGELEKRGNQYNKKNTQAKNISDTASQFTETPIDKEVLGKAENAYQQAENTNPQVACAKGNCMKTNVEESDDVGVGAVELGALGDMAHDVSEKQVNTGVAGVFGAKNIVCRERWGDVYQDYCTNDGSIFRATKAEKELHVAQEEGRAIRVPGGFICSRERKKWGKKRCVEKKQSWCVFQSKLALIIQVQGRAQLNLNFGSVGYHYNAANCSGFTPEQLGQIEFDTPQMKQALSAVMKEYTSKRKLPSESKITNRAEDYVNRKKGALNANIH